jgi:hypothetical protein
MVLIYITKKSYQKMLEGEGISCDETKLLNGTYKLRVFCWQYQEGNVRNKIKELIPTAQIVGVRRK